MTAKVLRIWIVQVVFAVSALPVFGAAVVAQEPQQVPAAAADANAAPNAQAKAAVDLVTTVYNINPVAMVEGQNKPMDKNGSWSVRAATPEERPAKCDAKGATCSEVVYRAGTPEIMCLWTVFFPQKGKAQIVRDNEASAEYMMVEKLGGLGLDKKDFPKLVDSGSSKPTYEIHSSNPLSGGSNGTAKVRLIIDTQGNVRRMNVESTTNEAVNQYAANTISPYKFSPLLLDGRAQSFVLLIGFNKQ